MGIFQPWHLIVVLLIVLVVFGAGKLGGLGGAVGKSIKDFKTTIADDDEDTKPIKKNQKTVVD